MALVSPAEPRLTTAPKDSGQAFVETAITMPLFVFVILGTLQLGLMHQAHALTKYAAYVLSRQPRTSVYIDASDADWLKVPDAVAMLKASGITYARGFALGATHYWAVSAQTTYAETGEQLPPSLLATLGGDTAHRRVRPASSNPRPPIDKL